MRWGHASEVEGLPDLPPRKWQLVRRQHPHLWLIGWFVSILLFGVALFLLRPTNGSSSPYPWIAATGAVGVLLIALSLVPSRKFGLAREYEVPSAQAFALVQRALGLDGYLRIAKVDSMKGEFTLNGPRGIVHGEETVRVTITESHPGRTTIQVRASSNPLQPVTWGGVERCVERTFVVIEGALTKGVARPGALNAPGLVASPT